LHRFICKAIYKYIFEFLTSKFYYIISIVCFSKFFVNLVMRLLGTYMYVCDIRIYNTLCDISIYIILFTYSGSDGLRSHPGTDLDPILTLSQLFVCFYRINWSCVQVEYKQRTYIHTLTPTSTNAIHLYYRQMHAPDTDNQRFKREKMACVNLYQKMCNCKHFLICMVKLSKNSGM